MLLVLLVSLLLPLSSATEQRPLLHHVLLSITSHASSSIQRRRTYGLRQTLDVIGESWGAYVKRLTIHIHTNDPSAIDTSSFTFHADFKVFEHTNLEHPHMLAQQYKQEWARILLHQSSSSLPSAFVYLEDDMEMTGESLAAWADDTSLLEAAGLANRGFLRSFYRYEYPNQLLYPNETTPYLIDSKRMHRVHCDPELLKAQASRFSASEADAAGGASSPKAHALQPFLGVFGNHLRWFVVPAVPYCAVTVLSATQAARWVRHPLFNESKYAGYPTREMAANGIHYASTEPIPSLRWSEGFRVLLPVVLRDAAPRKPQLYLDPVGGVHHASDHYLDHFMKPGRPTQAIKAAEYFLDWKPGRCYVSGGYQLHSRPH